jgi:hypothetical protein
MSLAYEKAKYLSIRADCEWSEKFVEDEIARDPAILNLGDLQFLQKQRRHSRGRLDLLLCEKSDSNTNWYEVELQLGSTDPSHIIRTIEYWDVERKRNPEYKHTAVIIAEEIDGRFFNVINLFSQHIPLIALKMSAISTGDKATLVFTRVADFLPRNSEQGVQVQVGKFDFDREYWVNRASEQSMKTVDDILSIAKTVDPTVTLKYDDKWTISLYQNESNYILCFWPKKRLVKMELPCPQSDELESQLQSLGIDYEHFAPEKGSYILSLFSDDIQAHKSLLVTLISQQIMNPEASMKDDGI